MAADHKPVMAPELADWAGPPNRARANPGPLASAFTRKQKSRHRTHAGLKGGPEAADKAPKQFESVSEAGLVGQEPRAQGGVMRRIRSHLTYANVMVTILAFLVLGGG